MDVKWANKKLGNHIYRNVEVVLSYCIFEYVEKCMCVCVRTRELKPKDMRQTLNLIWIVDSVAKVSLWNENPFHTLFLRIPSPMHICWSNYERFLWQIRQVLWSYWSEWTQVNTNEKATNHRICSNYIELKKKVCLMLSDWVGYIAAHGPLPKKTRTSRKKKLELVTLILIIHISFLPLFRIQIDTVLDMI